MTPSLILAPRHFDARVAELGFSADLPTDWIHHALPDEDVDFGNPATFVPLAVLTAPHAAIVLAVAARPAHDDGTLHDWAWYHLNQQQLQPRAVGRGTVAGVGAVCGEALQPSDLGPMLVRFAFLEDGGRLINLTLTAPELLSVAVQDAWFALLPTFTLHTPRGSRFAAEPSFDHVPVPPEPEPAAMAAAPDFDAVRDSETGEPLLTPALQLSLPAPLATRRTRLFDFALSDDSASLDDDHPVNAHLRQRGIGLVPAIAGLSDAERTATLAAGAVMAQIDVPYGWHVIDDGRRTLVFEPGNEVQINLSLLPRHGRSDADVLADLEAEMRRDCPEPVFDRPRSAWPTLHARHIADGAQALEQLQLLRPFRDEAMVLRARVTSTPQHAAIAANLAELMLERCVFDEVARPEGEPGFEIEAETEAGQADESASRPDGPPRWWHEALALEAAGRLDDAEQHIRQSCPYLGYACSTAEMYRLRMLRLLQQGDADAARQAFIKASDWIWRYASMATSGGEGAALSLERDEFRAQLVAEYGSDPEARW